MRREADLSDAEMRRSAAARHSARPRRPLQNALQRRVRGARRAGSPRRSRTISKETNGTTRKKRRRKGERRRKKRRRGATESLRCFSRWIRDCRILWIQRCGKKECLENQKKYTEKKLESVDTAMLSSPPRLVDIWKTARWRSTTNS